MKNSWKEGDLKYGLLLVFSLSWGMIAISCSRKQESPSLHVTNLIQTVQVTRRDFNRTVAGYGYVKATRKRDIVAHTQGVIEQVWVKEGDKVTKGKKLLRVRGTGSSPEMARIKAEMEIAEAELNRQHKEYQRIKALKEAGGSYEKEKENVYANYKKALEAFNAAEQEYYSYTNGMVITSPINGYVTSLTKFPGNAVKIGELLVSIVDLGKLLAEVEVFGSRVDSVKPGQLAVIIADKERLSGEVSFISTEINRETGARKVGIEILQKKTVKMLSGDFVKAYIVVERHPSSLAIPEEALLNDRGQKVVMVKVGQTYEKRDIVIGLYNQGYVEVLSGLSEGEEVATVGAYEILNIGIEKKMKVED